MSIAYFLFRRTESFDVKENSTLDKYNSVYGPWRITNNFYCKRSIYLALFFLVSLRIFLASAKVCTQETHLAAIFDPYLVTFY
jgi:hypothetical protein